ENYRKTGLNIPFNMDRYPLMRGTRKERKVEMSVIFLLGRMPDFLRFSKTKIAFQNVISRSKIQLNMFATCHA
ncbi:MAG: hypothetical protein L0I33_09865, partial [Acetobacter sp.]|nr:hypothetical protein [Acetobacter sp.]